MKDLSCHTLGLLLEYKLSYCTRTHFFMCLELETKGIEQITAKTERDLFFSFSPEYH